MSDVPELIEPIEVVIKQLDKVKTVQNGGVNGMREIVNAPILSPDIKIQAQVAFGDSEQLGIMSQLGTEEQVKGYMVLRYADIASLAVKLQRGDRVTKLGQLDVEYYLLHGQGDPAAHFSSIGGFTLTRMFFSDRNPNGGKK